MARRKPNIAVQGWARELDLANALAVRERLLRRERIEFEAEEQERARHLAAKRNRDAGRHQVENSESSERRSSATSAGSRRRRRRATAGQRMVFLTAEQIDQIHVALVDAYATDYDPIEPGTRDNGRLLQSAATRPQTSWNGVMKYKSVHEAAAALTHSLVHNHPFVDGNKRTATVALLAFLNENKKVLLVPDNDELFEKIRLLAAHELAHAANGTGFTQDADAEVAVLAKWIKGTIDSRYRPMVARKLFRVLERQGCIIDRSKQGNTVSIERYRQRAGERLVTHISVRGDGHELKKNTVKKVCQDLQLDRNGGFEIYKEQEAAEFIDDWRDILDKMGELDRGVR